MILKILFKIIKEKAYLISFLIFSGVVGYLNDILFEVLVFSLTVILLTYIYTEYKLKDWIRNYKRGEKTYAYGFIYDEFCSLIEQLDEDKKSSSSKFELLNKRFKELSAAMPDSTVILDKNKKIEWFNSEAQKLFKFNKVYDEGTPITHIIRNPIFVEYINLEEISKEPVYFKHDKKDEVISIQVFEVPFGKDMSLLTFRDISAFEKLDSVRSDFIANVSHELKTPLTVISGYLEMLKSDSIGKEESQKFYNEMLDQSLRMNRIIGDLILITNLQTTKPIESKKEKINLNKITSEIIYDLKPILTKRKQSINIISKADIFVYGLYKEIYSAFMNLITNAVHYSAPNLNVEIDFGYTNSGSIYYSVKDYGFGIEDKEIERLTERFYRVDKGRSRNQGGTGLGLSIVKQVLNRHDAELNIESKLDEGSNFTILFNNQANYKNSPKSASNI